MRYADFLHNIVEAKLRYNRVKESGRYNTASLDLHLAVADNIDLLLSFREKALERLERGLAVFESALKEAA